MNRFAKKSLSVFLAALMVISCLASIAPNHVHAASFTQAGGWLESIYAEISGVSDSSVTAVSYSGTISGSLTGDDLTYLVRDGSNGVRIDIPGLPAGTYTLNVTAGGTTYTASGIEVMAHDRSGYAHFNYNSGIGAYNDDGSLKANAIVLYVTNENKNTVSVTSKDGTTVTGIGNILGSTGMDAGTGLNSKGGAANTNQDILRKLAADGTPLCIRFVGTVSAHTGNTLGADYLIDGLTAYDSTDYGGTVGDNGYMARMSGGKDITLEGIGSDAVIDGWGFHFICQTADYPLGYGSSFEARNLVFRNVPEDCLGMEGQQEGSTITAPVERCWVHNCSFYGPSISNPAESDKDGGDGACDFKRGNYMTMDYCYYEGYHKTNLIGSADSSLQYHITWHHNYYKNCEARGPLVRNSDIHIYNTIFDSQTSYAMNPRANAYIFSEYNSFINCKNPVQVRSGAVKSYNDTFTSCIGDMQQTEVSNKSQTVSTNCAYANFDTNASVSYVPSANYDLDTDYDTMLRKIKAYAGAMPTTIVEPEDVVTSGIPNDRYPGAAVALPYNKSLNNSVFTSTTGTFDNMIVNVGKVASDSITVGGKAVGYDIVFYVDVPVNISMTEISGTYSPVLCAANGQALITGTGSVTNVPAGYYYICSSGWDPGSSKYKEAKVASLSIEAYDPSATPVVPTTPPVTEAPDVPVVTTPNGGSTPSGSVPSGGGTVTAGSYVHDFTANGKTSTFYSITGNTSTSKGTVSYNGLNLTTCLKMESSTNISFTAPDSGTLTLVFGGSTAASGKSVKVDGTSCTVGSDGTYTCSVAAGAHTITKGDSINLFYMVYTPDSAAHTCEFVAGETVAPTCEEEGYTVYTCECGATEKRDTVAALGHSYATVVTAPTCTAQGYTTYTCGTCGDSYEADQVAMLEHTYVDGFCSVCGKEDPATHVCEFVKGETVAPTCEAEGYTVYTCSCGLTEKRDTVAALGHSYSSVVTAPTCTAEGYTTYTCATCGNSYTADTTAMVAHTTSLVGKADATCTDKGYTGDEVCSVCNTTVTKGSDIAALGHSFVNGTCSVCGKDQASVGSITEAAGHLESAYVEWNAVDGASGYNVYVKATSASAWTQIDSMLIREYPNKLMRADALGLKAGTYTMKIVPIIGGTAQDAQAMETDTMTVLAHDRGGYAHAQGNTVGAYNNDGTLKSNAVVVYVTEDTKNTVSANIPGAGTFTGLSNILAASTLKVATAPICVRFIGNVTDLGSGSAFDKGDLLIDNNNTKQGLTLEGVGEDAAINGFGIRLKNSCSVEIRNLAVMNVDSSEGDNIGLQQNCQQIWVHNCDLFYGLAGSDADQAKGDGALDTKKSEYVTHSYNHFWDTGKSNLQGGTSSDTSNYITYHHNWYDHSDSRHPRVRRATVHVYNNYYDGVAKYGIGATLDSDIFAEANYFRNTRFPMLISEQANDITGGGIFSGEAGGMIKAYGNIIEYNGVAKLDSETYVNENLNDVGVDAFIGSHENATEFDAVVVENRNDTVSGFSAVSGGASYNNFDTASGFYSYNVDTAEQAKANCIAYAGRMNGGDFKWTFTAADDTDYGVNAELKAALAAHDDKIVAIGGNSVSGGSTPVEPPVTEPGETTPSNPTTPTDPAPAGGYVHNFTENGKTSTFYTITGNTSTSKGSVSYAGLTLTTCLKMESTTNISFTAPAEGTFTLVFGGSTAASGKKVKIDGTSVSVGSDGTYTCVLAAGAHTVTKGDSINLFYMVFVPDEQGSEGGDVHTHEYTSAVTTPATCETAGVRTYTCSCGESYTEAIPALGHSYTSATTTHPSCTEEGVLTYTCATCGHSYTEAIAALDHTYSIHVVEPTCTTQGNYTYVCENCGDSYIDSYVPATGHTAEVLAGKAATCTEAGLTEGSVCSVCGEGLTAQEEIPATGHSYTASTTVPTCTAEGKTVYTCACGDSYSESIPATGHTAEAVPGKAATCTETGLTEGSVCSVCGEVLTAQEEIAALGHSFADGVCGVCGAEDPDYVDPDPSLKQGLQKGEDGEYYYYIDGVVQESYTGLIANSAGRWYILNGHAELSYDGLIEFEGTKYLIKAGRVNTAFTGITKQEGVYYYFAEGVNDLEFEGLVYCNGMKAYVQNGEVNFNKSGVVEDEGNLVYVKYGIWRNTFKGLARADDGNWLYFVNGTFDATYTGVAKLNANWVYVENGYVNFNYSGTITVGAYDYTVKYGVVQF